MLKRWYTGGKGANVFVLIDGKKYESDRNWIFGTKGEARRFAQKLREKRSTKRVLARVIKLPYGDYQVFMRFK